MATATTPTIDPDTTVPLIQPSEHEEGFWVGAPSVHATGTGAYLAVRQRSPEDRGHTLLVYERTGTTAFEPVTRIQATDLGVESIERPALLTDPASGEWKLYLSVDHGANEWTIQKLDDAPSPSDFDPSTARTVLQPRPGRSDSHTVKDPYVLHADGRYFMYYAGYDGRSEQAHLAMSPDGERWTRAEGNPVLGRQYWHDYHTRITCVVPDPDGAGWIVFYDGSGSQDYRNTWNLRTGIATTSDLLTVVDVTTDGPAYATDRSDSRSPRARYCTFRYVDVLDGGDEWTLFYEAAREDEAFELRQTTVHVDG